MAFPYLPYRYSIDTPWIVYGSQRFFLQNIMLKVKQGALPSSCWSIRENKNHVVIINWLD